MKDLSIYFEPYAQQNQFSEAFLGGHVNVYTDGKWPELKSGSLALIFCSEQRASEYSLTVDVDLVRNELFNLTKLSGTVPVADLGVIHPGNTLDDTYAALREVIAELVKSSVFPIVIGGGQDLTFPIYQGYKFLEQTVNILNVDARLDIGSPDESIKADGWLTRILMEKPGYLFNYTLFGYQSYFVTESEKDLLEKMFFDSFRLGEFYTNSRLVEPLVRNADILSFDMTSIKTADYPSNVKCNPHGFYGEDACRILRYAGLSDKLTSLGILNLAVKEKQDAQLISQMIWYFIEGYNNRKKDYPVGTKKDYIRYIVNIDDFKDEIVFYKSNKSGRWWMEVPYPKVEGMKFQRHLMVPCDYQDYENALKNDLPDLWWRTFNKLS